MIFVNKTLKEWMQKYPSLKIQQTKCPKCNTKLTSDRPFITKNFAGITSLPCPSCGNDTIICRSKVTISDASKNSWLSVLDI